MSVSIESDHPALQIEKLQAGDPGEFQKLYQLHYRDFVEEARQLLSDKNKAPELVKHSFIKCWLKCNVLNTGEHFAFLRTSVNMHCYNFNNSKKYSPAQENILNEIILGVACEGQDRDAVYDEICATPAAQKAIAHEAFEKTYVRGLPLSTVAAGMSLSEKETQEMLNLAFKALHLILSLKPL